jgi:hypothetical protein
MGIWNLKLGTWNKRSANPDQDFAVLIDGQSLRGDEFVLQVLQIVVIQREASFQRPVRDTALALEQVDHLSQDFVKRHPRSLFAVLQTSALSREPASRARLCGVGSLDQ